MVLPESPYQSIADVVKTAKAKPNFISLGMPGVGGTGDLTGYLWRQAAGIELMHVPYRGWAQAYPDLASNRIDMYVGSVATLLSQIRGGKVRALGVVATDRSPAPARRAHLRGQRLSHDQPIHLVGLMAPGKTPDDVVATLNQALRKVQAKPELVKKLEDAGYTVMSGTPADLAQRHRADHDVFDKVVRDAGIPKQ